MTNTYLYTATQSTVCTSHMFTASVLPASKSTESGFSLQPACHRATQPISAIGKCVSSTLYIEIIYMHFPQSVPRHCHLDSTGYHFKYWENHAHANGYHLVNVCLYIHRVRFTLSVMHIWTYHPLIYTHTQGGKVPWVPASKSPESQDYCYTYTFNFGITSDRFT